MSNHSTDTARELQELIYETIALGSAMQLEVRQLDGNSAALVAPVRGANFNIHDTAFAGSIYSLCALTAWGLVHMRLLKEDLEADVVIARAEISYRLPVYENIQTYCQLDEKAYREFHTQLLEHGKARIDARVEVKEEEKLQAALDANVAVRLILA